MGDTYSLQIDQAPQTHIRWELDASNDAIRYTESETRCDILVTKVDFCGGIPKEGHSPGLEFTCLEAGFLSPDAQASTLGHILG
jgi:hypothetical protein